MERNKTSNYSGKRQLMSTGAAMVALLLLLTFVTVSFADDVTGSLEVTGGSLTISATDNPLFPGITLNGTAQTITDTVGIDLKDFRGTGDGWHLEVTSTTFTNAGGKTLPNTALTITGVSSVCDGTTCTDPTNSNTYAITVPADTVAPTAVEFFEAAAATGLGDFTITPAFELMTPATTYAGTYNSTITLTVANTP